jgi:glucan biosynthesis protein C
MAEHKRYVFIDHLRGFIFALMAFDHALHAYAYRWGPFWFFRDYDRTDFFDALYLFDQSIIMPMLFFIVGMFVLPALERNGFWGYYKKRVIKLGIPFVIGVPVIVPLLSYPKFHEYTDPGPTYFEYWTSIFFSEKLQAGPFWVLYAILLYSTILILLAKIVPGLMKAVSGYVTVIRNQPLLGIGSFMILSALVYGMSDLIWGAPWWIGFGKLFYLQGARFIMNFVYFLMGAGLMASGLMDDDTLWRRWSSHILLLGGLMGAVAIGYVGYALAYFDQGAYNSDLLRHFLASGGTWQEAWPLISDIAPGVLIRTTLLGVLTCFQVLFLLAFFYRFCNQPTPWWQSLARNAYGIFLFHEAMVVWLQFALVDFSFSPYLKMLIVFSLGFSGAWALTAQVRKIPGVNAVL